MVTTVREALSNLGNRWDPAKIGSRDFVLQYELTEAQHGDLDRVYVAFMQGVPNVGAGSCTSPTMTIQMKAADFIEMVNGEFDMETAKARGDVVLTGRTGYGCLLHNGRRTPA